MNWIEKIEVEKIEAGHPRNSEDFPLLWVYIIPHEGNAVEIGVPLRCLTAVELANTFRAVAGAFERWGDDAGITKSNLEAMVATGALPPEALN